MSVLYTASVVIDYPDSISKGKVMDLIQRSQTNDLSDMSGVFSPTREDLSNDDIIRKANEFIDTCSMNNRHCSFRYIERSLGIIKKDILNWENSVIFNSSILHSCKG